MLKLIGFTGRVSVDGWRLFAALHAMPGERFEASNNDVCRDAGIERGNLLRAFAQLSGIYLTYESEGIETSMPLARGTLRDGELSGSLPLKSLIAATGIDLRIASRLRSRHGLALYSLMSWEGHGKPHSASTYILPVHRVKRMLGYDPDARWAEVKRSGLAVGIDDVNIAAADKFSVVFREIHGGKSGRKVVNIEIEVQVTAVEGEPALAGQPEVVVEAVATLEAIAEQSGQDSAVVDVEVPGAMPVPSKPSAKPLQRPFGGFKGAAKASEPPKASVPKPQAAHVQDAKPLPPVPPRVGVPDDDECPF
jgi:hypothetical protein